MRVELLIAKNLKPHEQVEPQALAQAVQRLKTATRFTDPIWVDEQTHVILDGHHRWHAFLLLGYERIPCVVVNYHQENIVLASRHGTEISKQDVLVRAQQGELYPPKSTHHKMPFFSQMPKFELPSLKPIARKNQ